jgi:hypothetical protein
VLVYSVILIIYNKLSQKTESREVQQIVNQPRDTYGSRTGRLLEGLLEEDEPRLFIDETWLAEKVYPFGQV